MALATPTLGDLIAGRYRVEAELGRGGMGVVLRAHDTRLNRTVAVKMLAAEAVQSKLLRQRLASEARIASALNHPGIATVYDFIELDDAAFIIYEFGPGRTLRRHLESERFSFSETLDAALQLTEALTAAHDNGITHRDLKPENIMVTPDSSGGCRMKILDFGLAKQLQQPGHVEAAALTQTMLAQTAPGFLLGTIAYMAPEQLEGELVDPRTDIYALGLVLYEMATGVHPFRGATLAATLANALTATAPPPSRHNSTLTAEFDSAVLKCIRKNPSDRFQSSREILVDLRNITHDRNSAPAHAVIAPTEPGVARRIFSLVLRHGWELLHVRLCIWCVMLAYVAWRFRLATPGAVGLAMFFAALICTTVLSVLLFTLLYTHIADKDRLAAEVRRMAPWFRILSIMIGLLAWVMAVMVAATHTVLAVFLILMGTKFGVMVLTLKPTMDRGVLSSKDLT
jgi:tRNA A-37 threonylcarbamoyl transferase component Bud32